MATVAVPVTREIDFYRKMTVGLALFILFGFAQFALRGMVDYQRVPLIFHVHGAVMVSWLALLVAQPLLVARDNLALHRRLGWLGAGLATVIAPLAIATCIAAIRANLVPPFFTPPFFLTLVSLGATMFTLTVWAAIAYRRQTDWHRRLMIGAAVLLMEPALGRLLPMPLLGGEGGELLAMVFQLGVLGLVVRHDRSLLGRTHPATTAAVVIVVLNHALLSLISRLPLVAYLAASITA